MGGSPPAVQFVFDTNKRAYEAPLLPVIEACKEMRLRLIHSGPTVRNRQRCQFAHVLETANARLGVIARLEAAQPCASETLPARNRP